MLALAIVMSFGIASASAQIYVNLRPERPHYVRTVAPSPRHVWIDEDWQERDGRYEWNGGRWAEPPHEGDRYRPGHWGHSDHGHSWKAGRWDHGHGDHDHGDHHDRH